MSLFSLLNQWKTDPSIAPNITAWHIFPKRNPVLVDFPPDLDQEIQSYLYSLGIESLYMHQLQAWNLIREGKNITQVTGTASGKTLSYTLPVLQDLHKNGSRRALFLYPTKALAHDQLSILKGYPSISAATYDGDTPSNRRVALRNTSQIIISNPDMLHLGILPYHIHWADFFSELRYVVLDEIHVYRGVFGSHVANILRRLKRLCTHYGSSPQFLLSSATIGNPRELAASLIEEPISLIDQDQSSRGEKHFLVYNPPIIDERLGLRAGMQRECIRLTADIVDFNFQTILFGRSRRSVEFMVTRLREKTSLPPESIRAYRSGYLPSQRRKIESNLRSRQIQVVTATTALELGIDIGSLDASVLAGYPGTITGTLQQAGRSGRKDAPSLSVLVASSTPLDQYVALFPDYLFSSNPEEALIDPDNLHIVLDHILCSAYELPFKTGEQYGNFDVMQTREILEFLQGAGKLHQSEDKFFWMHDSYPASDVSIRTTSNNQIALKYVDPQGKHRVLGMVDKESAPWMIHEGAIYLHEGESYLVENLNLEEDSAQLIPVSLDYYTEAERQTSFSALDILKEEDIQGAQKFLGEISVTSQVIGYKKINWGHYELLGHETLDLPPSTLNTTGFWMTLSEDTESNLRKAGTWSSSPNDYGSNWLTSRELILKRDEYKCQICGKSNSLASLQIHHKQPLRSFLSINEANLPANLITLCSRCHQRAESIVRVNSGVRGLGYVLHGLAPLLLMCDPGDLGFYTDSISPLGNKRPLVLLYEHIPSGIGFSENLFRREDELLKKALELVSHCSCLNGCPSCVGPGGEKGSGGKLETLAILEHLCC